MNIKLDIKRSLDSERPLAVLLITPALLVIVTVIFYPLFSTIYLAFTNKNLLRPYAGTSFVGLRNFSWLFTESEVFWRAVFNSVLLTASTVILLLIIGIPVALALNSGFRGQKLVRGVTILPWAVPTVVAAIMWTWALNPQFGWFNKFLIGIRVVEQGIPWLGDPKYAMIGVILAHIWKQLPFVVLVLLAGLQSIPHELREAARVDGAGPWAEFWSITLPGLSYVIWIIVMLRTIWTFNWFEFVYLLTGGGPADSTFTLPIFVYKSAFRTYRVGEAAAIATFMLAILVVCIMVFTKIQARTANS